MSRQTREVSAARALQTLIGKLDAARAVVAELEGRLAQMQGAIGAALPGARRSQVAPTSLPPELQAMLPEQDDPPGDVGDVAPGDNPREGRWI